jgi:predicted AAA+ superfamily ATPase
MLKKRYLTPFIVEDLKEKMVFVGGPREVGKTTLCLDPANPEKRDKPLIIKN